MNRQTPFCLEGFLLENGEEKMVNSNIGCPFVSLKIANLTESSACPNTMGLMGGGMKKNKLTWKGFPFVFERPDKSIWFFWTQVFVLWLQDRCLQEISEDSNAKIFRWSSELFIQGFDQAEITQVRKENELLFMLHVRRKNEQKVSKEEH